MRDLRCCRGPTASATNCGPASQCQAKDDGRGSDRLRPAGGRGPLVSDTQEPALGGTEAPRLLPEGATATHGWGRGRRRLASGERPCARTGCVLGPLPRLSGARRPLLRWVRRGSVFSTRVRARVAGPGRPPFRGSRERRGRPCLCVGAPAQGGSAGRPAARCTRFLNKFPWRH